MNAASSRAMPWAVVPVKDLVNAKQRLVPALTPTHRRGLYRAMLLDVLSALSQVSCFAGILIVTRDAEVRELATPFGVEFLNEDTNNGHTSAVTRAARALCEQSVATLLQVPGDVPLVSPAEIERLIDAHRAAPAITITPSRDKRGSNAMLCSPPDVLPFQFGDDSFALHLQSARRLGIDPVIVESPGIALDIDEPDDLYQFVASPSPTRAYAYLEDARLVDRLTNR